MHEDQQKIKSLIRFVVWTIFYSRRERESVERRTTGDRPVSPQYRGNIKVETKFKSIPGTGVIIIYRPASTQIPLSFQQRNMTYSTET